MKAVVYARVANFQRAEERLAEQIETCRRYAEAQRLEVVAVFRDIAPGTGLDRPELTHLRRLVASEQVGLVLVVALSRLSRKPSDLLTLYREFDRVGTGIYYLRRQPDSPTAGAVPWREDSGE